MPTRANGVVRWIAALGVVLALSPRAHAQELECAPMRSEARRALAKGQRAKPAVAMLGLGGAVLVASAVTFGVATRGEEVCGLTGCFRHPSDSGKLAAGALAAAGATIALVALPALLDARYVERGPPRGPARMAWGLSLTATGAGLVAANIAMGIALSKLPKQASAGDGDEPRLSTTGSNFGRTLPGEIDRNAVGVLMAIQGLVAAVHLGLGIPLWAGGGRSQPGVMQARLIPTGSGAAVVASF